MSQKKEITSIDEFENLLKKALNTPLPEKEAKRAKKKLPWTGLPLDLDFFANLFGKKPLK